MGADLYIKSIHDPRRKAWEEAGRNYEQWNEFHLDDLDCYFRDSYNDSNLLWRLGLDYWEWFNSFLDSEDNLQEYQIREVLETIKVAPFNDNDLSEEDRVYFIEKRENLTKFLSHALEINSSISCSI